MKMRIKTFVHKTIDLYLPCNNIIFKLENATAKLYIEQHLDKLNRFLNMFADEDGEIDEQLVMRTYEKALFNDDGELQVDVKELLSERFDINSSFLPDKIIIFKKEDIYRLFR